MNFLRNLTAFPALLVASLLILNTAAAERAPLDQKQLTSLATHIVSGVVQNAYHRRETQSEFEYTFTVTEIQIKTVDKGSDLKIDDRIFVKSYEKEWLGPAARKPDDEYGHNQVPEVGDSVQAFLSGNRQEGYQVLYPNGYFKIQKQCQTETTGN